MWLLQSNSLLCNSWPASWGTLCTSYRSRSLPRDRSPDAPSPAAAVTTWSCACSSIDSQPDRDVERSVARSVDHPFGSADSSANRVYAERKCAWKCVTRRTRDWSTKCLWSSRGKGWEFEEEQQPRHHTYLQMKHIGKLKGDLREVAMFDGQRTQLGKPLQFARLIKNILGPTADHHLLCRVQHAKLGAARVESIKREPAMLLRETYARLSRLFMPP